MFMLDCDERSSPHAKKLTVIREFGATWTTRFRGSNVIGPKGRLCAIGPVGPQDSNGRVPRLLGARCTRTNLEVGFTYPQWWYSCHMGVILYLLDFVKK